MADFTIEEAAAHTGFSSQYIRYLIRNGKLKSRLEPVTEGSSTLRHKIEEADLEDFMENGRTHSRRGDKRNKFVFYATLEEYPEVIKAIRNAGLTDVADSMLPANTIKSIGFIRNPIDDKGSRFIEE